MILSCGTILVGSIQTIVFRPLILIYSTFPLIDFASNFAAREKFLPFLLFLLVLLFSFEAQFLSRQKSFDAESSSSFLLGSAYVKILEMKKFCSSGITCVYFEDSS